MTASIRNSLFYKKWGRQHAMESAKKNRNLFRLSRIILLRLPFVLRFFSKKRVCKKEILIICNDAIGDYILCRNFLEAVRNSKKFAGYKIVLLGNELWKELALAYDHAFVDEFIFIKPEDLYYDPQSTCKIAFNLYKRRFETVLVPCSTRRLINDGLAGISCAGNTIGYVSDNEAIFQKYKKHTDKFYSRLITLPANIFFEFQRNKFFFESVLDEKIEFNKPRLTNEKIKDNFIIVAPGSGRKERNWEFEKFIVIINRLIEYTNETIYILGGKSERDLGEKIKQEIQADRVIDLTGKLNFTEFINTVSKACLVIANETSILHIANACNVDNIYILGGGHYNRFAPYPDQYDNVSRAVWKEMECYNCNWNCIHEILPGNPFPCISSVSADQVWDMIKKQIDGNKQNNLE